MKEQSAVDFLHSKILFNIGLDDNDIFKLRELVKIAKKLEEKQHGKTWDAALNASQNRAWNVMRAYSDFDDWYAETFGSEGSGVLTEGSGAVNNIGGAVELPKQETLYTEEQVREAIDMATTSKYDYKLNFYSSDEIIQSLKQPKKD